MNINIKKKYIIKYLKQIWNGKYKNNTYHIFNYISNIYYCFMNKFNLLYIKKIMPNLKKLGFTFYNGNNNNEQPINKRISKKELEYVLKFKNNLMIINLFKIFFQILLFGKKFYLPTRQNIIKKIGNCDVFTKPKGDILIKPENYRYLINHHNTIKILDRILYYEILKKCGNNLPNPDIFKISFSIINYKKSSKNNNNTLFRDNTLSNISNNNTLSRNNVLLLDLVRAYDSLEWNVIEELLYCNLKRKMNILYANEFVQQYMIILTNRIIKYKKTTIKISKGIPTGLPTSTLIFTFIIEEIIIRWMEDNKFNNNIDFIINIYVDDIYIKFLNLYKIDKIISSLIIYLTRYKLIINYNKSKIDENLYKIFDITKIFKSLNETDLYLGIPFTRNYKLYSNIILLNLNKKHNLNYNWTDIYNIINNKNNKHYKKIIGFMNYKLKPLFNNNIQYNQLNYLFLHNINNIINKFINLSL